MTTKNVVVLDEIMKTSVGRDNNVDDPPPNTAVLAIISFLPTIHLFRLHLIFVLIWFKKSLRGEIWFKRGLTPSLTYVIVWAGLINSIFWLNSFSIESLPCPGTWRTALCRCLPPWRQYYSLRCVKCAKFLKGSNHITSSKMYLSHLVSGKSYQEIGQSHLAHEFSQNTPMQFVEQHFLPPRTCQSHCPHRAKHVGEIVAIFIVSTVIWMVTKFLIMKLTSSS